MDSVSALDYSKLQVVEVSALNIPRIPPSAKCTLF